MVHDIAQLDSVLGWRIQHLSNLMSGSLALHSSGVPWEAMYGPSPLFSDMDVEAGWMTIASVRWRGISPTTDIC